ncbi:MAG: hydantoinase B/oxoprolinase family protein [Candidatus Binataceae bacterium]|nr:hydantoinase B/oxoprolinase family protein [Candidatus Binataceae bacterium]
MATIIPGSEIFAFRPVDESTLRRAALDHLKLHTVLDNDHAALDPITYEVIRHRMWATTQEMGDAFRRMSGSVVVTGANDFNFGIMDELGNTVQLGPYNLALGVLFDSAVKWSLQHRADNPGIEDGDMFLCNDPWVGGGIHQNDVAVFAPIFWEGELFAWTAATAHQLDLGGVAPGSWTPHSRSVFWESLPTPPVKIVRGGRLQRDVEDVYLRRSRIPRLVALDLRAQIGANSFAQEHMRALIRKYGPDVVKAVMKRQIADTEGRLRAKLRELPDGSWRSIAYQEEAREGDRGVYRIVLTLTKKLDHLTFDFRGTDPQVEGLINCTFNGLQGGIIWGIMPTLCGDIPWSPAGVMRCFDVISEPGTLNNANFPAGISQASVASGWSTMNATIECLSQMLDAHPKRRETVIAGCEGTVAITVFAGVNQHRSPFVVMLMDTNAGGLGARIDQDGVDTGGQVAITMASIPDVEMTELMNPLLYLWRREEIDSGGPGKFRGGVGASICVIAHGTDERMAMVISGSGKAVNMNPGLAGGYPGNSQIDLAIRKADVRSLFARGIVPSSIDEMRGEVEYLPSHKESYFDANDVYYQFWQAGGGYMDPLLRDPEMVLHDIVESRVCVQAARSICGVALKPLGREIDEPETARLREQIRAERKRRARVMKHFESAAASATASIGKRRDDNLVQIGEGETAVLQCLHCGKILCRGNENHADYLAMIEGAPAEAGPQIFPNPALFVNVGIVFRQYCCPGCFTALLTQVVPEDHPLTGVVSAIP